MVAPRLMLSNITNAHLQEYAKTALRRSSRSSLHAAADAFCTVITALRMSARVVLAVSGELALIANPGLWSKRSR